MATDAGNRPMNSATSAVGSIILLRWTSTLLHCSEKVVDTVRLRLPTVPIRLSVDNDEQHSSRCSISELQSDTENSGLLSLPMVLLVV